MKLKEFKEQIKKLNEKDIINFNINEKYNKTSDDSLLLVEVKIKYVVDKIEL